VRSWSISSIRQFHACSLAWYFQRTGVQPEFKPLALVEGTAVHAAIEHHLLGLRDGNVPGEEEGVELLRAAYFAEETGGAIRYGKKEHDEILERLSTLFLFWRRGLKLDGEIVSVEQEILVTLPGIELPLRGYADLVLRRPDGSDAVWDFKTSAAKPSPDPLLDPLDLQKLAMTRGWEAKSGRTVGSWRWEYLVKTKSPNVVDVDLPVAGRDRDIDLGRLAAVVNPTLKLTEAVLAGKLDPVPTQAPFRMCGTCPFRARQCVLWGTAPVAARAWDQSDRGLRRPPG
jgi:RecB family exonuclease